MSEEERIVADAVDIWDYSDCTSPAEPIDEMVETAVRHAIRETARVCERKADHAYLSPAILQKDRKAALRLAAVEASRIYHSCSTYTFDRTRQMMKSTEELEAEIEKLTRERDEWETRLTTETILWREEREGLLTERDEAREIEKRATLAEQITSEDLERMSAQRDAAIRRLGEAEFDRDALAERVRALEVVAETLLGVVEKLKQGLGAQYGREINRAKAQARAALSPESREE